MADETPETPAEKAPRRRSRAASAQEPKTPPAVAADAEKPKRPRRRPAAKDTPPAPEAAAKGAGPRARAKTAPDATAPQAAAEKETPSKAPGRVRGRSAADSEPPATAEAEAPTPKPARARAGAKPPATRGGGSRRLLPGRGGRASKGNPELPQQLVFAQARYVRSSARKARLVCDHIRGKSVPEARAILAFAPRGVAKDWSKLLDSAVANAEHNHELIGDELHIKAVFADVGPTLKRFRPRAMGRATPINKRTSHLSITLAPKE
jgi:ribosomal protein L22